MICILELLNERKGDKTIRNIQDIEQECLEDISNFSYGSRKIVTWLCPNYHKYQMSIQNRTLNNYNCPICAGKKLLIGYNDVTQSDKIMEEWDYENNTLENIYPENVQLFSHKYVWFVCKLGHKYKAKINAHCGNKTNGCPYCSGQKVLKGFNDLESNYKEIVNNEWDYNKNIIIPSEIHKGSNKKVWWKCSQCNNSYEQQISKHINYNQSCPKCKNKTSFGEQAIYYYLKEIGAKNRYKFHNKEIDIYLEKLNIGIEFEGEYWHRNRKDKDLSKELYLSHYMKMFYVLESNENKLIDNKIYFKTKNYNENLEWAIKQLFNLLNLNINVDLQKDNQKIFLQGKKSTLENSFAYCFSDKLIYWNYELNEVNPNSVSKYSMLNVYWKCTLGHVWKANVGDIAQNKSHCPYCSGHKVLEGFNDIKSLFPKLMEEWDWVENYKAGLDPSQISQGSGKKAYWICPNGHKYKSAIVSRTKGCGCDKCSRQKHITEINKCRKKKLDKKL